MKAIVTGAAGFIGSHIVDKLIKEGFEVISIDDLSSGVEENINPKAKFVKMDIRNLDQLKEYTYDCDYFFHCAAAMPIVKPPFEDTVEHEEINVIGTIQCIKSLVGTKIKKFVYASSCAVYGEAKNLPISENSMIDLQSRPYTINKFTGEQYALLLGERYEIPVVSLRFFANYGPRSINLKKSTNTYSPVIGIFLNQSLANKSLTITGDGSQTRDFINVEDTARIVLEVALHDKAVNDIYNVCSGNRISIKQLAEMISDDYVYIDRTYGEVEHIHGDNSKLAKLGIIPKISLSEGINNLRAYLLETNPDSSS
ncbi:NAD-dependent epimerase/dehydratase family protein [Gammaproteobacteria bacterium]|jgi:UDP-glucose 4-epimerase|nr:NAD-dependent epimerase/dehydratase family protein [Gammaproteobacteria bacterium]